MTTSLLRVIVFAGTAAFAQTRVHAGFPPMHPRPAHHFPFGAFPFFSGEYDYVPLPSVVAVQPSPLYIVIPEASPEPAKSEIHEYPKPAASEARPATEDQQAFGIVLADGSVHSAVAVTVQGRALYYVEPDGGHRLVSLDGVDREATGRLNRERKLQLQLPPST